MKKLFIDKIQLEEKKERVGPGPGSYQSKQFFGKDGKKYSLRPLVNYNPALAKAGQFPGPGQYSSPGTLGDKSLSKLLSKMSGQGGSTFPKTPDRFKVPCFK
eukprot:CAMPEP_0202967034 /NCGR_PEP_ID=MMETSP1396-20130829/11770_1 /ASSEMBLY_ACC=CAM_ASM_000872 /TAXON_ID= /ORGANISM="Pseudokeronopsis sp., Strain Brazil" /LENGTH=101 /DNA_ID=CAMNT_0049691651 /DNA_START=345 /DNA_END=650 /DNA_ORIENTATION=+